MGPEIIESAAREIARGWLDSGSAKPAEIFSETLTCKLNEPVAEILRAVEETREELVRAMQLAATISNQPVAEQLPKSAGLPAVDVSEIARKIDIVKPSVRALLGISALAPYVRRQLQEQLNRGLLELLSLYSNRLRRWMEQTLGAMRKAFVATADVYRAQFEGAQLEGAPDATAVESDLRALHQWESA